MTTKSEIKTYIASQPEPKRSDLQRLHELTLKASPGCKLWFSDGKDASGRVVANPSIGHGLYTIEYADGTSREFFQIGLSANATGISVYILGLADKKYLAKTFGKKLGAAKVTGYCIRFKSLSDIHLPSLTAAIKHGFAEHPQKPKAKK